MKSEWLDRALSFCSSYYCLCLTEKDYHKQLKHLKIPKEDWTPFVSNWHSSATTHFYESKKDNTISAIICIQHWKDKTGIQIAALLVHEAVHLWQETLKNYGEHDPSQEYEAYAIQNLSQNLMESFVKQRGLSYVHNL